MYVERLESFHKWMTKTKIGLLRSPPRSGKSTLATLLAAYLEFNKERTVIKLNVLSCPNDCSSVEFDNFWLEKLGPKEPRMTWTQCYKSTGVGLDIIIDEAQTIYGKVPFFWEKLKELQGLKDSGIRILLLSAYGKPTHDLGTPLEFKNTLGLDQLCFPINEFEGLVEKIHSPLLPTVRQWIYDATAGHPGLVRTTLACLLDLSRDGRTTEAEHIQFLLSPQYRRKINDTRALEWMKTWEPVEEEVDFLRDALDKSKQPGSTFDSWPNIEGKYWFKQLLKNGLLAPVGDQYRFVIPLVRMYLSVHFFRKSKLSSLQAPDSFEDFIKRSLERMRPSYLSKSLEYSRGKKDKLHEKVWQTEWLKAAFSLLPNDIFIWENVGSTFNSLGSLDFYIDSGLCWGVELLRKGDRMSQHLGRFDENRTYSKIDLKEWAILDFRHQSRTLNANDHPPNFYHVFYNDDFSQFTIRHNGHKNVTLTLRGDESK